jgi:hypothetical protein
MKKLQPIPLIFVGDHHGQYQDIIDIADRFKLTDCYLIHVGDGGEGFIANKKQTKEFEKLNKQFEERKIWYKSIRGNHSDPFYFRGANRISLDHFELIEDYSIYSYGDKTIQFVGGAISIDRTNRIKMLSYWPDEELECFPELCKQVDVLVTHTAPSWCYPQQFNEMVFGWARQDKHLLEDLKIERELMDEIFTICKPSLHLYGHFHTSWTENINGCKHKLLDINEFWQLQF